MRSTAKVKTPGWRSSSRYTARGLGAYLVVTRVSTISTFNARGAWTLVIAHAIAVLGDYHAEGGTTTNCATAEPCTLADRLDRELFEEGVAVVDHIVNRLEKGSSLIGATIIVRAGQRSEFEIHFPDGAEVVNDDRRFEDSEILIEEVVSYCAIYDMLLDVPDGTSGYYSGL